MNVTISERRMRSLLRAEAVARELRHQFSTNRHEPSRLVELLGRWLTIAPRVKWTRPER